MGRLRTHRAMVAALPPPRPHPVATRPALPWAPPENASVRHSFRDFPMHQDAFKRLSRDFQLGQRAPPLRSAWALFGKPERAKRSSSPFPPVQPLKPLKFLKPPNFLAQAPKQRKFSGGAQVPSAPQDAPRRPRHPQDSPQDGPRRFQNAPCPQDAHQNTPGRPQDAPRRPPRCPKTAQDAPKSPPQAAPCLCLPSRK